MGQKRFPRSRSAPDGRRHRVLVAEDGDFNRDLVRILLERAGFQVDLVNDGAKAIAAVRTAPTPYRFLLMDLDMPVMDGCVATEAIRRLDAGLGAVPILALTASTGPFQVSQALASGMDGYIGKPFDPATFADNVQSCLAEADEACRRRRMAGVVASAPVWNRRTFDDLSLYLDHTHIREMVDLFEQQLNRARTVLQQDNPTRLAVANEAHNLVSAAGSFGFERLCAASHHAQAVLMSSPEPSRERVGNLVADLLAALLQAQSTMQENVAQGTLFDGLGLSD